VAGLRYRKGTKEFAASFVFFLRPLHEIEVAYLIECTDPGDKFWMLGNGVGMMTQQKFNKIAAAKYINHIKSKIIFIFILLFCNY